MDPRHPVPEKLARATLAQGATSSARGVPPPPPYGPRGRVAAGVLQRIFTEVPVTATLRGHTVWGDPATAEARMVISDPRAMFARIGRSPLIGLGESYMAGEWAPAEGEDLAAVLVPFGRRLNDLVHPLLHRFRRLVLPSAVRAEANTPDGARLNIHRHYDLSNAMFAQFLDPSLTYSCALFDTLDPPPRPEDLGAAQLAKVDAALDRARVGTGTRVLEIGTGWGTLAIRAAQRGAAVTTITISGEQAALARERVAAAGVADRVEIALRDYRDQSGEFDAVVSVEMVEAVGAEYWPAYFSAIDRLLAPQGVAVVQAIMLDHERFLATRHTYTWLNKYIFPGGQLPSLEAIETVLDDHTQLRLEDVHRMDEHYVHTLRLWRSTFTDHWPAIEELGFEEEFRRMWEFYLAYCQAGFATGRLHVAQLTIGR